MVRKVRYTVKATGVEPATIQFGGVQGEHRATKLIFNLASELKVFLQAQKNDDNELKYRIDVYDGAGGVVRTDTNVLSIDADISYLLEEKSTRYGGTVKVVLVITLIENSNTEMEVCSFPVILRLKNKPDDIKLHDEYESLSTLAEIARKNAEAAAREKEIAVSVREETELAKEQTELARAALDGDTEWIFDGGDAAGAVDIEFVIDGQMSDASGNAIANKVVKQYVDERTTDWIVESGVYKSQVEANGSLDSTITWTYRKWKSGIAECWGEIGDISVCPANDWGDAHYFDTISGIIFPNGLFSNSPSVFASVSEETGNLFIVKRHTEINNTGAFYIVSPTKFTKSVIAKISLFAKGIWEVDENAE